METGIMTGTISYSRPQGSVSAVERAEVKRIGFSTLAAFAGCFFACRTSFVLIAARWINIGTVPGVLAGLGISVTLLSVALVAGCGPRSHSTEWILQARPLQRVVLYIAFAGCSLLWSASADPAASAMYWCGLVLDVATVVLLCRACGKECAAHSLMKGFIAGSVLLAAMAWMMPAAEDLRLGDLDYFNTNQIANLCTLAILMCTLLASRGDSVSQFAAPILAITLFRSLSKATLIAFVAAQVYRLASDSAMSARKKWLLVSGSAVLTICFWGVVDAYFGIYTATGNQAETLTGRTAIWAWSLDAGLTRPWFGNGFDAMWKVAPPFGGELFEARHAENELLQQFFAYGACGVALLMGVYGSLYRRCRLLPQGSERSILISFLVFVLVRGLAEAEPFDLLLPLWLIAALAPLVEEGRAPRRDMSMQPEYLSNASAAPAI